ncbi:MAG: cation diffusion facilitator family transporter [Tissierella sp.]|uniref:cation diffusion facilitator family transporter n=1 Tax=Tissierella sp. TaxID=41274 RepID=UPI003F977265
MSNHKNSNSTREDIAIKVSRNSIIVTLLLSIFKLTAGIVASSGAMISDGVHSASDVLSTLGVMLGIKMSHKEADKEHPYGHERLECVVAIILSVILTITALGIAQVGLRKILSRNYGNLTIPGTLALVAAIISIIAQEALYRYTKTNADKINSGALLADAWHHRTDALSSVGSFIGIFGARLGFPILDPLASIVISIFILKAAVEIFKDAIDKMVDKSCDKALEDEIKELVLEQSGVIRIREMKTRMFANVIYVDLTIIADANKTLGEGQVVADRVHDKIEKKFELVKHIDVHVHPD